MKSNLVPSLFVVLLCFPVNSFAHHGKEFLVGSTYKTPAQGQFFALLSSDYVKSTNHHSGFELSPGILYGLSDQWSAEFHTHHGLSEGHSHFESLGLETRYRILGSTDSADHHGEGSKAHHDGELTPFPLAALLEYEKGLSGTPDDIEGRLITGQDFRRLSVVLNLILQKKFSEGEKVEFRYAFGLKTNLTQTFAAGIEIDGGTSYHSAVHLTPGLYASVSNSFDLRVGASFSLGNKENNATSIRSVFIWGF